MKNKNSKEEHLQEERIFTNYDFLKKRCEDLITKLKGIVLRIETSDPLKKVK